MIELLALWLLRPAVASMADAKRRDRGWFALVFIAWLGVELFVWVVARSVGLPMIVAYPVALVAGAAAGLSVVAVLRARPSIPVFDPRVYDKTWSEGACPQCGSEQTYSCPIKMRCFACDYYGEPSRGRPKPPRASTRPNRR